MNQSKTKLGENNQQFQILVEENGRFYLQNYFLAFPLNGKI